MKPLDEDRYYLIRWSDFLKYAVDKSDLAMRDSKIVENYYRSDWFSDDEVFFIPPVFNMKHRQFINGRHRTVLLSHHLKSFPMTIFMHDPLIDKFAIREMKEGEVFELPDLPIKKIIEEKHDATPMEDLPTMHIYKKEE